MKLNLRSGFRARSVGLLSRQARSVGLLSRQDRSVGLLGRQDRSVGLLGRQEPQQKSWWKVSLGV